MSPFEALYGKDPPTLFKMEDDSSVKEIVNEQLKAQNLILVMLKGNLEKAQDHMKTQADKHKRDVDLAEGDLVYLKLQPYK